MRQKYRIIVEGMDGSGKTTLIRQLMGLRPDLEIIRNNLEDKMDFNTWWPQVVERPDGPDVPIHDRFYYSELVYGTVLRGHINAEPVLVQNILWFLRSNSALIYARPHQDKIREGIQNKPQMEGVTDNFDKLLEFYDSLMDAETNWYGNRFFHYVWDREDELMRVDRFLRSYTSGDLG